MDGWLVGWMDTVSGRIALLSLAALRHSGSGARLRVRADDLHSLICGGAGKRGGKLTGVEVHKDATPNELLMNRGNHNKIHQIWSMSLQGSLPYSTLLFICFD